MGYPMTYQRFVKRNMLEDCDYQKPPESLAQWWQQHGYLAEAFTPEERRWFDRDNTERKELERRLSMLSGDLRRLEKDAQDENAVCKYIAWKTGINAEQVAIILKEFMAW